MEKGLTKNNSRPLELLIECKATRSGVSGHAEAQGPHDSHFLDYSIKSPLLTILDDFEDQIKIPSHVNEKIIESVFKAVTQNVN